jgi:hypothetical protein
LRVVAYREHASIRFGFQYHPALGKPLHGVAWLPTVKGGPQGTLSPGIMLRQQLGLKAGMGYIAATAAGDAHFLQKAATLLKYRYAQCGIELRRLQRSEKSTRTTTNHGEVKIIVNVGLRIHWEGSGYKIIIAPPILESSCSC